MYNKTIVEWCLFSRNATTTSKLDFRVYSEHMSHCEVIGQAAVDLLPVLQKHRYKSKCLCVQTLANI